MAPATPSVRTERALTPVTDEETALATSAASSYAGRAGHAIHASGHAATSAAASYAVASGWPAALALLDDLIAA